MVAARKDTRYAKLFRTCFVSRAEPAHGRVSDIPNFDYDPVFKAIKNAIDDNAAYVAFDQNGNIFEGTATDKYIMVRLAAIQQILDSNGKVSGHGILVTYTNPYISDPAKLRLKINQYEVLKVGDGEAIAMGAHLIILKLEKSGPFPDHCKCVLEEMPGLSRDRTMMTIQSAISKFIEDHERHSYVKTDKKTKKEYTGRALPKVVHHAVKNESLEEDLNGKSLYSINFLKSSSRTDEIPISGVDFEVETRELVVKESHRQGARAQSIISFARKLAKIENSRMRANFQYTEDNQRK